MVLTGKDLGVVRPPGGPEWIGPGRSAAFEQRFSVLAPSAMPFRLILSELECHEAVQISVCSFGERDVISRVYRFLRHSRGQRRQRANVFRDVPCVVHQFGMRNQPLCETDSISFLSAKRKTHREAHRVTLADPARSPDRTALRRQDSECHLGQAPLGAFRCDDKVAAEGKNASDADRVSIDGGYYRLREIGQHTDGTGATASGRSSRKSATEFSVWVRGFLRSAPALNAPPLSSPVKMTQRTSRSPSSSGRRSRKPARNSEHHALRASGRLSVRIARLPCFSQISGIACPPLNQDS